MTNAPLTPDFVADLDRLAAEADERGKEIVRTIDFLRADGSTATLPLSRDHAAWLDYVVRNRVNKCNSSWLRKIEAVLDQLEKLAESHAG